ncbi:MAG: sugar phosphate isomerase/epimerase [Clostridia bacterium]|nr:sugar phosphate isomerase/epimerase [Clostridia bacterium]
MTNRKDWALSLSCPATRFNEDMLRQYQTAGIRNMELTSGDLYVYTDQLSYTQNGSAAAIYALAKSYDVTIGSFHLPFQPFETMDPADPDKGLREKMIAAQSELIRAAAGSGIGIAVIHPSAEPYTEEERGHRLDLAIEVIDRLTAVAKSAGMVLALENLPRTCLCRSHDEMLRFLDAIPDLRVCFDTNHNLSEPNEDYIRAVGSKIVTLHISDYDFIDERHLLPGDGKIDWNSLLSTLEAENYTGRFNYEIKMNLYSPADAAENYRNLMK